MTRDPSQPIRALTFSRPCKRSRPVRRLNCTHASGRMEWWPHLTRARQSDLFSRLWGEFRLYHVLMSLNSRNENTHTHKPIRMADIHLFFGSSHKLEARRGSDFRFLVVVFARFFLVLRPNNGRASSVLLVLVSCSCSFALHSPSQASLSKPKGREIDGQLLWN